MSFSLVPWGKTSLLVSVPFYFKKKTLNDMKCTVFKLPSILVITKQLKIFLVNRYQMAQNRMGMISYPLLADLPRTSLFKLKQDQSPSHAL